MTAKKPPPQTYPLEWIDRHANWTAHEEAVEAATAAWSWLVTRLKHGVEVTADDLAKARQDMSLGLVTVRGWGRS